MVSVNVIEWVRDPAGVWTLPRERAAALAAAVPGAEVWTPATREEAEALLPRADVVLGSLVRPHNLARAERLRWIHSTAASVSHLLFPELVAHPSQMTNARGLHADAMAEHTLGVMLTFTRQLHLARDAQQRRRWRQVELWQHPPGFEPLAGATLGLVGFGAIGSAIASRARALGMRVLAVRRHPAADPAPAHEQWGPERLGELLEASDWLVLAAPHTHATERLIGARELARMRAGARLVNLARGALVDEAALLDALRSGRLAGAALDVFADEPLPESSEWWALDNVLVTPHVSGLAPRFWERALEQFVDNLRRFVAGEPLRNVVDKAAGY